MSSSPSISGGAREPLPMPDKQYRFSDVAIAEMEEIATHYPERKAACLPTLWIAQREYGGYLTPNAIQEVADRLGNVVSGSGGRCDVSTRCTTCARSGGIIWKSAPA